MGFILLQGRAAFQRDLDELEKLAGRKHAEFNKDTCKTASLGWAKMLINR